MSLKYVQSLTLYQAGAGNIIGATSVVLTTLTDIYGNAITTMTPFGAKGYCTAEPDTTNEEAFTFTGVTANANGTTTLTGVSTSLAQSPYTETSGLVRQHSGGTKVVVTDNVAFWNTFANKQNNETITGKYTLPGDNVNRPTLGSDVDTVTTTDLVTLGQLSRQAISGASNASTTVKGIVQEATQAQVLTKTAAGSTGAELYVNPLTLPSTLLSDYKVDTGAANAYVITPAPAITAYTVGQIFSFKAVSANTTASTINVNALGAKTIKNAKAGDLVANDILAGQIVVVEYDGTNFQMISLSGNLQAKTLQSATTIVDVSAATAPSSGQVLTATGATTATWQSIATAPAQYVFGTLTDLATSALGNNDAIVATTFTPRLIRLHYFIQGHDRSADSNAYYGAKGIALYNAATLVSDTRIWGNDAGIGSSSGGTALSGDNGKPASIAGADFPNSPTTAVAPTVGGGAAAGNAAIGITLSVASVSSTTFVVRRLTASTSTSPATARAQIYYEAFA